MDSAAMVVAKKKAISSSASGYKNYSVSYDTDGAPILTIEFQNGDSADLKFPLAPKGDNGEDGVSVVSASVKNGHLILTKDDGSEVDCGVLPTSDYDDTPIRTLISDEVNTLNTTIDTVADGLMASAGYSSDYKAVEIVTRGGDKKSIDVAPVITHASLTELKDVDNTNIGNGKSIVYNAASGSHEYVEITGTDEKVKMDAASDAKYMSALIDKVTLVDESGVLKVKKLDGQEATIDEINYLKGLTMNVMDLVNMFANGGVKVINTPVATYADLLTLDKSAFIEGITYIVYVLSDENHSGAKTTYLVDKDTSTPTFFGNADSQRNFTTDPISLVTEITGKLGIANIDLDALWTALSVDDTYKTTTATNNVFSTHGAKALYDELMADIGLKANTSDLTAHTGDTDIHVSTTEKDLWNTVADKAGKAELEAHTSDTDIHITADERTSWNDKIDKSSIAESIDSTCTDEQVTGAKLFYDNCIKPHPIYEYYTSSGSLSDLGINNYSEITSLLVLTNKMKSPSRVNIQVNQSDRQTLYDNGVIPILNGGVLIIEKLSNRCRATYSTDSGLLYACCSSNGDVTEFTSWTNITEPQNQEIVAQGDFDFNDYTTRGIYFFSTAYGTLSNAPSLVNGWLYVLRGDVFIKQIVHRAGTPGTNSFQQYERESADYGSTWSDWILVGNKSNIITYTSLAQIGLPVDQTATLNNVWNALDTNAIIIFDNSTIASSEIPSTSYGTFYIAKYNKHRGIIQFIEKESGIVHVQGVATDGSGVYGNWKHITTTTISDKAMASLTLSTDQSNYVSGGDCWYKIKNGFCTIHFNINCTTTTTTDTVILSDLPIPSATFRFTLSNVYNSTTTCTMGYVSTTGKVYMQGGITGRNYYIGSITYPIKE